MINFANDNEVFEAIRLNIIRYRTEKHITSAELAEQTGLSHDYIRQLQCNSKKYRCSLISLYKISLALEIGIEKFFEAEQS